VSATARLQRRAGTHTVWLELDYDGADPPTDLFADLAMLGWHPPAAATPPHDAIDWSVPDHERGLDYSIRAWRVLGAAVGPPAGSGHRGAWTETDVASFLPLLERILRRHEVVTAPVDRTTTNPPPVPPASAGPEAPAGAQSDPQPDAPGSLLTFVVEADQAVAVRRVLEAATLPFRATNATISVPQRYRGREFVAEVAGVRFEVAAHAGASDEVRRSLAALGVDERLARLTIEPLEPTGADTDDPGLAEVHPFRPKRGVA
jgi:hypothetical protein